MQVMGKNRIAKEFWGQNNSRFMTHKVHDPGTSQFSALGELCRLICRQTSSCPGGCHIEPPTAMSANTIRMCSLMQGTAQSFNFPIKRSPGPRGTIYAVLGNSIVNRIADEIFDEYQEQAKTGELQFRRFPLRSVSQSTSSTS